MARVGYNAKPCRNRTFCSTGIWSSERRTAGSPRPGGGLVRIASGLDSPCWVGFVWEVRTGGILLVLVILALAVGIGASAWFWTSRGVGLSEIDGIEPATLEMVGVTFEISEPIREHDGSYFFETEVIEGKMAGSRFSFWGDAERLNAFASELRYIDEAAILQIGRGTGRGAMGTVESYTSGAKSMAEGALKFFRDPEGLVSNVEVQEQANEWGASVDTIRQYVQGVASGDVDFVQDAQDLAQAFWANELEMTSSEHGFSYASAVVPEVQVRVERETGARLAGRTASELLVLAALYHPLGEAGPNRLSQQLITRSGGTITKLSPKFAKGATGVLRARDLFSEAAAIDRQLQRRERFARLSGVAGLTAVAVVPRALGGEQKSFDALTDPAKLASLDEKAAQERFLKLLAALAESNEPNQLLERLPDDHAEFFYSRELTKERLERALRRLDQWGIPDDESSRERMARGRSPEIRRGPYAGEEIAVVHRIPVEAAPELTGVLANLELLPARQVPEFDAVEAAMQEFEAVGWVPVQPEEQAAP